METTIMEATLEMETMAVSTKAIKVLETGMGLEALQVTISMKHHRMIKELRIVISTAQMAADCHKIINTFSCFSSRLKTKFCRESNNAYVSSSSIYH